MNERRTEALGIINEMLSPEIAKALERGSQSTEFGSEIAELAVDHAYADLWTRTGLDRKIRSIVTVSMMIALRDSQELSIHIPAAVRNGVTINELEEIIYHATGYVGFPAAASARNVAIKSLQEAGILQRK
jgi:4-carboxymuconolactone decarboxylase